MDNTYKYIGAGTGGAILLMGIFKLILTPSLQNSTLVFISIMLFAIMALLVVNIYLFSEKLTPTNNTNPISNHLNPEQ